MNIEDIEKMIKLLDRSSLTHFEYKSEYETIKLSKETTVVTAYSAPAAAPVAVPVTAPATAVASPSAIKPEAHSAEQAADPSVVEVSASYVGTISLNDEKTGKPLVTAGSRVKKGQIICQIEAMKLYNDVISPAAGEVLSVEVSNGDVVEFGTVIARIRRDEVNAV